MQFLKPHRDELFSSVVARYHVHSGHITAAQTAEEIFGNTKAVPNVEHLGALTEDTIHAIETIKPLRRWIWENTLFPEYGRFLPRDRYEKAMDAAERMNVAELRYLLFTPRGRPDNMLKYCPVCAAEDRSVYGETYWHRAHQLQGMTICARHNCYLIESNVSRINGNGAISAAAELVIPQGVKDETPVIPAAVASTLALRAAEYMETVFSAPEPLPDSVSVSDFLRYQIRLQYPISQRRYLADLERLIAEVNAYYKELTPPLGNMKGILNRMYKNKAMPFYEICMLAMILGIRSEELACPVLPEIDAAVAFDAEVLRRYEDGMSYVDIEKEQGVSKTYIKVICRGRKQHAKDHRGNSGSGGRSVNWKEEDNYRIPQVRAIVQDMINESHPPQRVTFGGVAKRLGMETAHLRRLPCCAAYVMKHYTSVDDNRAKKLVWALRRIDEAGDTLNKQRIFELVHMDRHMIETALPFLAKHASAEEYRRIKDLVER